MDTKTAGRGARATEILHSMVYFAPETEEHLTGAGLRPGRMCYFAGRAAAMGAVGPSVVTATFYNFNPELIARHIPRAWSLASPESLVAARLQAADAALRRLLGAELANSPEVAEAAELAHTATLGCTSEGRALYGGHADLAWPAEPLMRLWHGVTLLREHRGDGHIAALLAAGLSGVEALVSHTATGRGFTPAAARATRGWSEQEWAAAEAGLRERGLLDAEGGLTDAGTKLRAEVEAATDAMGLAPWQALGDAGAARMIELGKRLSAAVLAAGAFPDGVFAAASGHSTAPTQSGKAEE